MDNKSRFDAEVNVVGALLISPECCDAVFDIVSPSDFQGRITSAVAETVYRLRSNGSPIDATIVVNSLPPEMRNADTMEYLAECMDVVPTAANVATYCKTIRDLRLFDRMEDLESEMRLAAYHGSDVGEVTAKYIEKLQEIQDLSGKRGNTIGGGNLFDSYLEEQTDVILHPDKGYLMTNYKSLDDMLGGGFHRGGFYIVAARPGMGKTTLGVNLADQLASNGYKVLFVSLEMTMREMMNKRISRRIGFDYERLHRGDVSPAELEAVSEAAKELTDNGLILNTEYTLTVDDIASMIRRLGNIDAVFVDYIGLIAPTETNGSRYEDYTVISRKLKMLALTAQIPVITMAQLNRENTKRADNRPMLSDLRDTGALEQDANCVIMLHRPSYYDTEQDPPDNEEIELIVAKQRGAKTGTVKMQWFGSTGRIVDYSDFEESAFKEVETDDGEMPWNE